MEFIADFWSELRTVGLTALFNPTFLFLLIVLFFAGRLVGWLIRSVNLWRVIAFAYFLLFLYRPLMDAGLVIGGVFVLGAVSMQMDRFRQIFGGDFTLGGRFFGWFSGLWDGWLMRRNDQLHDENERLKAELRQERQKNQQSQGNNGGSTSTQDRWRQQARERVQTAQDGTDGQTGTQDNRQTQDDKQEPRTRQRRSKQGSGGHRARGRNNRPQGSGHRRGRRTAGSRKRPEEQKPNSESKPRQSRPRAQSASQAGSSHQQNQSAGQGPSSQAKSKSGSQSQSGSARRQQRSANSGTGPQNQSSGRQGSQSGSGQGQQQASTGYRMSQVAKNKLLKDLGLAPDKDYTKDELKTARNKAAFKAHPDRGGSTEAITKVLKAYALLLSEAD